MENCYMVRIKTKEELIEKLNEYDIPSDWYSFEYDNKKPVSLNGKRVNHRLSTYSKECQKGEEYDYMFNALVRYKKFVEFKQSDKQIHVYKIEVVCGEGQFFYKNQAGKYVVREISSYPDDDKLKKRGYVHDYYDQYMAWHYYNKETDDSIFQNIELTLKKRTTPEEKKMYGFEDEWNTGYLVYPIPEVLRDKIIKYIDEYYHDNTELEINDDKLIGEITTYFTEERILKDEEARLAACDVILRNDLYNELLRQKLLGIKERENLLDVYRRSSNTMDKEFFSRGIAGETRPYIVERECLREAEELWSHIEYVTLEELETYRKGT